MKHGYKSLNENTDILNKLMKWLISNLTSDDMDYMENNVNEGLALLNKLEHFNVFADLEAIYFENGKEDTKLIIERLHKSYPLAARFKRHYNSRRLKKATLYRSVALKKVIFHTVGILDNTIAEIKNFEGLYLGREKTTTHLPPQPIGKQKPELKINQIALKYAYEGLQITRENGNEIAKEYGHNSGEKLFQKFTYFLSSANRKGKPNLCTPKKLDNKIKLIESIIELLPIDKQERAKDEVSILKKIYDAEYQ